MVCGIACKRRRVRYKEESGRPLAVQIRAEMDNVDHDNG